MKKYTVAIDISPLSSGHKVRGVGHYTSHLQSSLNSLKQEKFNFIFYSKKEDVKESVDLWHIPYSDPFFMQIPLNNLSKTMVTVHDLTPIVLSELYPKGIRGSFAWQINKWALQHVQGIVTPSQSSKNDISRLALVSDEKIFVTPLGVDPLFHKITDKKKCASIRAKYQLPEKFALYVGDVTPNKNLPRLVRAATVAHMPLIMVGKSLTETDFDKTNAMNQDRIYVQNYCKEHPNIKLVGYVSDEDLALLFNVATCVVYPSLYEGFGLPVVQAMASGTPVITSSVSSLPEVVGEAALLIDPNDENTITTAMQSLLSDEKLADRLAKDGLLRAKRFTWEHHGEMVLKAYEAILTH